MTETASPLNTFNNNWDLILASASPRRASLMKEMGLNFRVMPLDTDEEIPAGIPVAEVAVALAVRKAAAFPSDMMLANTLLLTADTIVVKDGRILGKPANREEAIITLKALSGAMHEVITGIHLRALHKCLSFSVSTSVWFKELPEEQIAWYVDHYHPFDKAGAYGIQEWIGYTGICRIEGSYFNVVGLPTSRLYDALLQF
ncbi:MAG TPA: Maf family nucleotide pyrophosphatase [Bacteroidales bacterium]|nr:Maf family nucleotide pyrophosphatase [Bacteroidales bacterium]